MTFIYKGNTIILNYNNNVSLNELSYSIEEAMFCVNSGQVCGPLHNKDMDVIGSFEAKGEK